MSPCYENAGSVNGCGQVKLRYLISAARPFRELLACSRCSLSAFPDEGGGGRMSFYFNRIPDLLSGSAWLYFLLPLKSGRWLPVVALLLHGAGNPSLMVLILLHGAGSYASGCLSTRAGNAARGKKLWLIIGYSSLAVYCLL